MAAKKARIIQRCFALVRVESGGNVDVGSAYPDSFKSWADSGRGGGFDDVDRLDLGRFHLLEMKFGG
jgi:hypothetical protein